MVCPYQKPAQGMRVTWLGQSSAITEPNCKAFTPGTTGSGILFEAYHVAHELQPSGCPHLGQQRGGGQPGERRAALACRDLECDDNARDNISGIVLKAYGRQPGVTCAVLDNTKAACGVQHLSCGACCLQWLRWCWCLCWQASGSPLSRT
jgi:hypothetical protein